MCLYTLQENALVKKTIANRQIETKVLWIGRWSDDIKYDAIKALNWGGLKWLTIKNILVSVAICFYLNCKL